MKNPVTAVKNFVVKHETAITISATAIVTTFVVAGIVRTGFQQHNEFLKQHGLFEEFYNLVD